MPPREVVPRQLRHRLFLTAACESPGRSWCPLRVAPAPSAGLEQGTEVLLAARMAQNFIRAGRPMLLTELLNLVLAFRVGETPCGS